MLVNNRRIISVEEILPFYLVDLEDYQDDKDSEQISSINQVY